MMHFKFSNGEHGTYENGKKRVYKICDACGRECKSNFGYSFEYAYRGNWGKGQTGLCVACANKVVPILEEALDNMRKAEDRTPKAENRKSVLQQVLQQFEEDEDAKNKTVYL